MAKRRLIEHRPEPHHHHQDPDCHLRPKAISRLQTTFLLGLGLFLMEFIGAWLTSSLSLLADSYHVLGDLGAIGVTLLAGFLAERLRSRKRSYGYYRLEILSALFNGFILLGLAWSIFKSAADRFSTAHEVHSELMLIIAALGLAANVLMLKVLHGSHNHNLNIKSAYFHLVGDSISSVVVILSAIVIYFTGLSWVDAVGGIAVGVVLCLMSLRLIKESVHVLLEGTPDHMDPEEVEQEIRKQFPQIKNIHDFHIWEITSHLFAMTAHIEADIKNLEDTRILIDGLNQLISKKYGIGHTTFQVEAHSSQE